MRNEMVSTHVLCRCEKSPSLSWALLCQARQQPEKSNANQEGSEKRRLSRPSPLAGPCPLGRANLRFFKRLYVPFQISPSCRSGWRHAEFLGWPHTATAPRFGKYRSLQLRLWSRVKSTSENWKHMLNRLMILQTRKKLNYLKQI